MNPFSGGMKSGIPSGVGCRRNSRFSPICYLTHFSQHCNDFCTKFGYTIFTRTRGRNRILAHDSSSHQSNTPNKNPSPVIRKRRGGFLVFSVHRKNPYIRRENVFFGQQVYYNRKRQGGRSPNAGLCRRLWKTVFSPVFHTGPCRGCFVENFRPLHSRMEKGKLCRRPKVWKIKRRSRFPFRKKGVAPPFSRKTPPLGTEQIRLV